MAHAASARALRAVAPPVNAARIIDLLLGLRRRHEMTVIIVSYDPAVSAHSDRTVTLLDGRLR